MVFETFCTLKSHHFSLSVESVKTSFQMEILRNESPCDRERKEYILQNILRTIETAFLATREARQNENLLIGMLKFSFLSNTANLRKKMKTSEFGLQGRLGILDAWGTSSQLISDIIFSSCLASFSLWFVQQLVKHLQKGFDHSFSSILVGIVLEERDGNRSDQSCRGGF